MIPSSLTCPTALILRCICTLLSVYLAASCLKRMDFIPRCIYEGCCRYFNEDFAWASDWQQLEEISSFGMIKSTLASFPGCTSMPIINKVKQGGHSEGCWIRWNDNREYQSFMRLDESLLLAYFQNASARGPVHMLWHAYQMVVLFMCYTER